MGKPRETEAELALSGLVWVPLAVKSWQQTFQGLYRTSQAHIVGAQVSVTYKKLLPRTARMTGTKASVHRLQVNFPL